MQYDGETQHGSKERMSKKLHSAPLTTEHNNTMEETEHLSSFKGVLQSLVAI